MEKTWEGYLDRAELRAARELYRSLVERALLGVYITTVGGQFLYANRAAWEMLGYASGEELAAAGVQVLYNSPDQRLKLLRKLTEEGRVLGYEVDIVTRQGESRRLSVNATRSDERIVGMLIDVTDQRRAEEALRRSESRYAQLAEQARTFVWEVDADGRYTYVSPSVETILGYRPDELVGVKGFYDLCPEEDRDEVTAYGLERIREGRSFFNYENRLETKDGRVLWVVSSGLPMFDAEGRISGCRGTDIDISERKRHEEALRESEARFRTLFERLADAVFIVEFDGTILEANPAAVKQTGYAMEELVGQNIMGDLAADEPAVTYATAIDALKSGETVFFEEEKRRKDGTRYWTGCAVSPIEIAGRSLVLSVNRDITDRRHAEEKLRYLSTHDALTGAHNRAYFDEELARLARGRRFPVTVLMADVNGLKRVNDSHGHAAGDALLRRAHEVLRAGVRGEDVVARIGGDEFGVVLPETDAGAASRVVARIREGLATLNAQHPDDPLSMAFGTATAQPHEPLDAALRLADARMYEDKRGPCLDL